MEKSLGNKRNKIGDRDESEPDQIGDITQIHGNFQHGETRTFIRMEMDRRRRSLSTP